MTSEADKSLRSWTVRSAAPSEAEVLATFQLRMAWETEQVRLDADTVRRGVDAVFAVPSRGTYLVAELEGQLVACLLLTFEWSEWRNRTVLWIQSVYVLPEYRRCGVFRAMYAHVRQQVVSDPALGGIRLYVDRNNVRAQQTYAALGMNGEHYRTFEWMKPT